MKILTAILLVLAIFTLGGCKKNEVAEPSAVVTLDNLDKLKADNSGKVLILNVFATWCPPCEEETPALVNFYNNKKELPVELVGLSIDTDMGALAQFREHYKITYPVYRIPDKLRFRLMADKVPTTVIYKPDGSFHTILMGAINESVLENIIKGLI